MREDSAWMDNAGVRQRDAITQGNNNHSLKELKGLLRRT